MAAAKPPGGRSPAGGAGAVDGEEGGCGETSKHRGVDVAVLLGAEGCCGSLNPAAAQPRSPETAAAAAMAAVWKEDPTRVAAGQMESSKSSSSLSSLSLSDLWKVLGYE